MKKIISIILTAIVTCSFFIHPVMADELPSGSKTENTGQEIEAFVEKHQSTTAGMAVSVFTANEEIYTNYFGFTDKETKISTDENSVFEWGSATKLLVWTSIMQLYEQKKIDLDEDVRTYLPDEFMTNLKFSTPVTIKNLMNHNAGFQEMPYDLFTEAGNNFRSLDDALKKYEPEQVFEPGTVTAYSNWGVALAGYIVELVSGRKFYEYVNENIFKVLEMKHSSLKPDYSDNEFVRNQWEKLRCYTTRGKLMKKSHYYISLYPAGSCASTLNDFFTFAQALLKKDSKLFKSQETHDLLFEPTSTYSGTDIPQNCHGLWMLPFNKQVFGHGGNTAGCSSYVLVQPESGIGAVVMTNQSGESTYNGKMMDIIFGKYNYENYFSEPKPSPSGFFKSARTVLKGRLKLYSASFLAFPNDNTENFYVWNQEDNIVSMPYSDFISIPTTKLILELSLLILFVVAVIMWITMLLIKFIQKLMKKEKRPLGKWAASSMLIQLLLPVSIIYLAISAFGYRPSESYLWIFRFIAALLIILIVMFVYGLFKTIKTQMKKRTRAFCILTLFTLAVSISNIIYWNMFMFWEY